MFPVHYYHGHPLVHSQYDPIFVFLQFFNGLGLFFDDVWFWWVNLLKMDFISPLSSSTSPCFSCWHTFSTLATYSPIEGSLATTAKLSPWAKTCSWAFVSGVLERFLTQLLLLVVLVLLFCVWLSGTFNVWLLFCFWIDGTLDVLMFEWPSPFPPCLMFEWPPAFFWHSLSNLSLSVLSFQVSCFPFNLDKCVTLFHYFPVNSTFKMVYTCICLPFEHGDGIVYQPYFVIEQSSLSLLYYIVTFRCFHIAF